MNLRCNIGYTSMAAVFFVCATGTIGPRASAAPSGEKIFATSCAACHTGGKNSLNPSKPVIGSKKLATSAMFKDFLAKQNGRMPPYKTIVANDEALQALYVYVKAMK